MANAVRQMVITVNQAVREVRIVNVQTQKTQDARADHLDDPGNEQVEAPLNHFNGIGRSAKPIGGPENLCHRCSRLCKERVLRTAGWALPSALLVAMPKCPFCLAADIAIFTGVSVSVGVADVLRSTLIVVSSLALTGLLGACLLSRFSRRQVE